MNRMIVVMRLGRETDTYRSSHRYRARGRGEIATPVNQMSSNALVRVDMDGSDKTAR